MVRAWLAQGVGLNVHEEGRRRRLSGSCVLGLLVGLEAGGFDHRAVAERLAELGGADLLEPTAVLLTPANFSPSVRMRTLSPLHD
jgi:hypothetical protein